MKLSFHGAHARHGASPSTSPAALIDVTLSIAHGEQVAVIGPSGAGKTSWLQLAAGALRCTSGSVQLDEIDLSTLSGAALRRRRAGLFLAPQVPPLPPRQRVVTAVLAGRLPAMGLWASLRSLVYPLDIAAAESALARFDLQHKLFDRVDRLSGGERQRVGLARALLSTATLWLVDEPLSALDPARARQALASLQDEARARGVTLVAGLHQVDRALAAFPRVIGLRDGRVAFDLPAADVTPLLLGELYAQREQEWQQPQIGLPTVPAIGTGQAPLICR